MRKWLNNKQLSHCSSKQSQTKSVHSKSLKAFWKYQEHSNKCHGLGDLSLTKQNKLPCFIDRYGVFLHIILWFHSKILPRVLLIWIDTVLAHYLSYLFLKNLGSFKELFTVSLGTTLRRSLIFYTQFSGWLANFS